MQKDSKIENNNKVYFTLYTLRMDNRVYIEDLIVDKEKYPSAIKLNTVKLNQVMPINNGMEYEILTNKGDDRLEAALKLYEYKWHIIKMTIQGFTESLKHLEASIWRTIPYNEEEASRMIDFINADKYDLPNPPSLNEILEEIEKEAQDNDSQENKDK